MKVPTILFFSALLLFSSCADRQCEAFPSEWTGYFPYRYGDTLKFANLEEDTLVFSINMQETTGPYRIPWNHKCLCKSRQTFETDENQNIVIFGEIESYGVSPIFTCHIRWINNSNNNFWDDGGAQQKYTHRDSIYIEGDASNERFKNLLIIKDKGIVSFDDSVLNCTWRKVDL